MKFIKGVLAGIAWGLGIAAGIYVLAMALDLVACFFSCGSYECFSYNSCSSQIWDEIWDDFDGVIMLGGFCGLAGMSVGVIYGIVKQIQETKTKHERERRAAQEEEQRRIQAQERLLQEERNKRKREEAAQREAWSKQLKQNASALNQKAKATVRHCDVNKNNGDQVYLSPKFESVGLQNRVWDAIGVASLNIRLLENVANGLSRGC